MAEPAYERLLPHSSAPYRSDLSLHKAEDMDEAAVDHTPGVLQAPGISDRGKIKSQLLKPLMFGMPGHELQRC